MISSSRMTESQVRSVPWAVIAAPPRLKEATGLPAR
jgi:hypothetical protein